MSDTSEYWDDVKRPTVRQVGAVHYRPLDKAIAICGWDGGGTTPKREKVNCRDCNSKLKGSG